MSYLFSPSEASGARRAISLRAALQRAGMRVTVLTSLAAGHAPVDPVGAVKRAFDVRAARQRADQRILTGRATGTVRRAQPRPWSRLVAPDVMAATWAPFAIAESARLLRHDPPDVVFTTSPPESVHLVGLALRRRRVPWIADMRDGWSHESPLPRPFARRLDAALERAVIRRADAVTVVTEAQADDLERRFGCNGKVVRLTNGFSAANGRQDGDAPNTTRSLLDPKRFSLVYTGTLEANGKDPRPLATALTRVLDDRPELRHRLQVVFAGAFTQAETEVLTAPALRDVVRVVPGVPHRLATALQRAANGLILITPPAGTRNVATTKLYEYLAAAKPVFGACAGSEAARILWSSGDHVIAPPDDVDELARALHAYVDLWVVGSRAYAHRPEFPLENYDFERIAERLAALVAEVTGRRNAARANGAAGLRH